MNALGQQLRDWIEDAGGYVHPALQLSMATPYGRYVLRRRLLLASRLRVRKTASACQVLAANVKHCTFAN